MKWIVKGLEEPWGTNALKEKKERTMFQNGQFVLFLYLEILVQKIKE